MGLQQAERVRCTSPAGSPNRRQDAVCSCLPFPIQDQTGAAARDGWSASRVVSRGKTYKTPTTAERPNTPHILSGKRFLVNHLQLTPTTIGRPCLHKDSKASHADRTDPPASSKDELEGVSKP